MHATANWVKLDDGKASGAVLEYFRFKGASSFLVKVDQGYGAGVEHMVMDGAHVYACLKFNMRSRIYAFARIYTDEELAHAGRKVA